LKTSIIFAFLEFILFTAIVLFLLKFKKKHPLITFTDHTHVVVPNSCQLHLPSVSSADRRCITPRESCWCGGRPVVPHTCWVGCWGRWAELFLGRLGTELGQKKASL